MSFLYLTLLLAVSLLLGLATTTFFLWLGSRFVSIEKASLARLVGAAIGISVLSLGLSCLRLAFDDESGSLRTAAVLLAVALLVPWLWISWLLHTSLGRAAVVWGVALAGGIVVNWPLALLVRHTVAEAFVNSSGAMATAIYGPHANLQCEQCAYPFAIGTSGLPYMRRSGWVPEPIATGCPNCGNDVFTLLDAIEKFNRSGDRVLVNKLATPRRWDVITFRYPGDPTVCYVKRLVGLPGETIELADGDVFANSKRLQKAAGQVQDLWFLVHDTRFPAGTSPNDRTWRPEQPDNGWRREGSLWGFKAFQGQTGTLLFSAPVTDALAYNIDYAPSPVPRPPRPTVRDVKVGCRIAQCDPESEIRFTRDHGAWRLQAVVSARGDVDLMAEHGTRSDRAADATEATSATKKQAKLSRPLGKDTSIAFAVRDGQIYLLEDGRTVATLAFGPQDIASARTEAVLVDTEINGDQADAIDFPSQKNRVAVTASGGALQLARIVLHRDVYYLNPEQMRTEYHLSELFDRYHPCVLGDDEYYTLGDNSVQSKDSRFWGTVSRSAILGPVECIYWPPSRARTFR